MIVSTMNSKEKAAKAPVIFALLEERVIGFLDRNEKKIYKNKKTEVVLKRTFRLGTEGEWDVEVVCHEPSKSKRYFDYSWYAWQKYFVAHGKNELNRGTGLYLLGTVKKNVLFNLPPHLITRFKDRFYDEPEEVTLEQIKKDVVDQIGMCRAEFVKPGSKPLSEEEQKNWEKYRGNEGSNTVFYAHTLEGQFFGNAYVEFKGDEAHPNYICLTTYMDNDKLKYEQLAYSAEINRQKNNTEISTDAVKDDAKKVIKKIAKKGNVRDGLIEQKKQKIMESAERDFNNSLTDVMMKIRMRNLLHNIGQKAEEKLKKIGLMTL